MSKFKIFQIIILSVFCAWVFDVFVGRLLVAKISTLPVLNRWHILSPQAPIVINNREVIRTNDSGDAVAAADSVKSKLATIVQINGSQATVLGAAVNLTSDGLFATGNGVFLPGGNYRVVLNDGQSAVATSTMADPATGLVFFKAALNNVPVAPLGDSAALNAGEQVLLVRNSLQSYSYDFAASAVTSAQTDVAGQTFLSDRYSRSFFVAPTSGLLPGQAILNVKGEVVGLFSGGVVSSAVLRQALDNFLNNNGKFLRPEFDFSYEIITRAESGILNEPEGAKVLTVTEPRPNGLLVGDMITAVNDQKINQDYILETVMDNFKPGDKVNFTVTRGKQILVVAITAGELK